MANCGGCPYRWHDSDCEYCSARNNEIIDTKSYSKSTCPYYQEYERSSGSGSKSSTSGSGGNGCLGWIFGIIILWGIISFFLEKLG